VEEPSTEEKTHNTAVAITVDVLEDEDDALGVKVQNILKVLTLFADLQVSAGATQAVCHGIIH